MNDINIVLNEADQKGENDFALSRINEIINGSLDNIQCSILDYLDYSTREKTIDLLLKKIKNNGKIMLVFLDFFKFAKQYIDGKINGSSISNVIEKLKSVNDRSDIDILITKNKSIIIHKIYYENNFLVVILEKQL